MFTVCRFWVVVTTHERAAILWAGNFNISSYYCFLCERGPNALNMAIAVFTSLKAIIIIEL